MKILNSVFIKLSLSSTGGGGSNGGGGGGSSYCNGTINNNSQGSNTESNGYVKIYGPASASSASKKNLSFGALSGIIVGIILFFAISTAIFYYAYVVHKRNNNSATPLNSFVIGNLNLPTMLDAEFENNVQETSKKKKKYSHIELVTPFPLQEKCFVENEEVNTSTNARHFTTNPQLKKNKNLRKINVEVANISNFEEV
jgi:hypothetical protein